MSHINITRDKDRRPDIFHRGALELTFRFLREHSPSLALTIQNLLTQNFASTSRGTTEETVWFSGQSDTDRDPQKPKRPLKKDHLYIDLEPHTVGKIVAALTAIGQNSLSKQKRKSEKLLQLRNLIYQWVRLTEWLLHHAEPVSLH